MSDVHDVIELFADGEPVTPEALEAALADRDGRAHLIDLLVLRGFMKSPSLALPAATTAPATTRARTTGWLAMAAAIAVVSMMGGYLAGERAATTGQTAAQIEPVDAPVPTQVITFEPGVDWTEKRGGN